MLDSETAQHKTFLESSTTKELCKLAEQAGISIPPDLDRIFIIRELLDSMIDEELFAKPFTEKDTAPTSLNGAVSTPYTSSHNVKTASLPQQYHITYLEVLPRDPQWVYIFWEIKALERERYEMDPGFEGYALKALENKKSHGNRVENCMEGDFTESFTVSVGKEDNSWYLGFPSCGMYRIALWVRGLNITHILSSPFVLPKFVNNPGNSDYLSSPLIELSGVSDFSVLRSADRVSYNRS